MSMFDAATHYNGTEKQLERFDPAWAKASLFFRTRCVWHFGHGSSFRMQGLQAIHEQLDARRKRFEAGDTIELLHAIMLCAEENLPLPEWLALAFNERFTSTLKPGGPTSLDDAFYSKSRPTQTPNKAAQAQQDWQIGGRLWVAVREVAAEHGGLDAALDAVLSMKRWGVGKTKARKLVEMVDATQSELTGQQPLSRFWAIRRKR